MAEASVTEAGVESRAAPQVEDLFLPTPDGVQLAATLYLPPTGSGNGVALQINSSMATPRQYYRAFATHMAGRGFVVLTYDYRGIGGSHYDIPPPPARTAAAWASVDQTAAADFLAGRFPDCTRMLMGHSLGGQILGLCPRAGEWRAILLVATAHGWWKTWPRHRLRMWLRTYVLPPLIKMAPGLFRRRVEERSNMPYALTMEMMHYLRTRDFFVDEQGQPVRPYNDAIHAPLRHIVLSDDDVVIPGSDIDVPYTYPNAKFFRDFRTPADYGTDKVNHFGFFRRSMPVAAWDDAADWLLKHRAG
jgi:predicted alpha/beta hydrolase